MSSTFKKSVLIPLATYKTLISKKKVISEIKEPISEKISSIEKRQEELINQRLYNVPPYTVLSTNQNIHKQFPSSTDSPSLYLDDSMVGIPVPEILSHIRGGQVPNMRSILKKMLELNVLWDKDGEININSRVIKNSNIIDIMKYFSNPSTKVEPAGTETLWIHLSPHIPKSWFRNKPSINRRKVTPLVTSRYPLEDSELKYLRQQKNRLDQKIRDAEGSDAEESGASDDEYSDEEYKDRRTDISSDHIQIESDIQNSDDESGKKQEASADISDNDNILDMEVIKTPTPIFSHDILSTTETESPTVLSKSKVKRLSLKEKLKSKSLNKKRDIFGRVYREEEDPQKNQYRSTRGRLSKRNQKYRSQEWETDWKQ